MFVWAWLVGSSLWTTKRKIIAIFFKNTWVELYSRKILQGLLKGQPILGEDEPKFYTHSRTDEKLPAEKPPSAFV